MPSQCAVCKGKGLCGLPSCPITRRFHALKDTRPVSEYMGASPSVFVGSYGYPRVVGGPLMINDSDNPLDWVRQGFSIDDIVSVRSRTIRGGSDLDVKIPNIGKVQEIALSARPLDVEVAFEKPVSFDINFDGTVTPVGMSGAMKKLDVIDNASVSRIVDRCTSDTDLKATEAARIMFENGTDVYKITNLLTAGLLGVKRRVVPTRWAITATDDMISTSIKREVIKMPALPEYQVFSGTLYGNTICFILIPSNDWRFEMLERWQKHSLWSGDEETIVVDGERGLSKPKYSPIAGAYYSARLAVLEYLKSIGRCARVLCIRDISGEYWAPLGTWVIREAAHASLSSPADRVGTLQEALTSASQKLGTSFWIQKMGLLRDIRQQKTLFEF
jgi:DNA repair protein NreA